MKQLLFAMAVIILPFSNKAQMAGQKIHEQMADTMKLLFNAKNFTGIYKLATPEFRSSVPEKSMIKLLETGLYNSLGEIKSWQLLQEDTGFYAFILNYTDAKVLMKLGVDQEKQIAFLQYLPYKQAPVGKRLSYFSDNKKQSGLDSLIDKTVISYMQSPQNCGMSIAVYSNSQNHFYNYGEIKRDSKITTSQNSIYEIGSITKTFCGILLAKAILEKKVRLDADIRKYLKDDYPELSFNKKPILIKHLANHTSGLSRIPADISKQPAFDPKNPYAGYTKEMLLNHLKTIKPVTEPGTVFDYSNMGMALLGIILEDVYGKTFEELVKEKICVPNKLNTTSVQLNTEQELNFAQGYTDEGEATPHWTLGDLKAAGALRSTAQDMLSYLNYNLLETDEAVKLSHQSTYKANKENIAMAWFIKTTKQGNTLIWHNGGTYGFSSFCGFIKEKNCSVVILTNSAVNVDYIGIAILNYLQK